MLSFYDWRDNPSELRSRKQERPRRVLGHGLMFEFLERRCLLSVLDIASASSGQPGPLTYTETYGGTTNELSIVSTGAGGSYTVVDRFQTITLSNSAIALGWSGSGTNTVTGPTSSVTSLAISTANPDSNLTVGSIDGPTVVAGFQAVDLGSSPTGGPLTLQGIRQPLSIANPPGQTTALTLDDSGDTLSPSWQINPNSISGAAPAPISWTAGQINHLNMIGGSGVNSFSINDLPSPTNLNSGTGTGSINVVATSQDLTIIAEGAPIGSSRNVVRVLAGQGIGGTVSVQGQGGRTDLTIDGSLSAVNFNGTLAQGVISGLTTQPIQFGGAALLGITLATGSGADTLNVDFTGGNPIPAGLGLFWQGGQGINSLVLRGGSFTNESYSAVNSTNGFIGLDTSQFSFSQVSSILDTVPAANFNFIASTSVVAVNVVDGPIAQGLQTTRISSGDNPVAFAPIDFANKTNVQLDLTRDGTTSAGGELITLNTPTRAAGLASLTILASSSADQINVPATAPGVRTVINSGPGNDLVSVLATGLGAGGNDLFDGGTGNDTLNIDAAGGAVTITANSVSVAQHPTIDLANFEQVNVFNAANGTLTPIPTTISGSAGFPLSNVLAGRFADADPNESFNHFNATINWGDGTAPTPGVVAQYAGPGTAFEVFGSHTYASSGTFPVSVNVVDPPSTSTTSFQGVTFTVSDLGGGTTINSSAVIVATSLNAVPLPITVTEDQSFTRPLVSFRPTGFPSESVFTATINWGDGTAPSAGTIVAQQDGSFVINGTHLYLRESAPGVPYQVTISIVDARNVVTRITTTATVLSGDIVTTEADSGPGSLRFVIQDVNADQIPTTITFKIPGAGAHRITPTSPLPVISFPVVIDGSSQPGFQGQPLIAISGNQAGAVANGLTLAGGASTVKSLVINGFGGSGLLLEGPGGDRVIGNRIGTDLSGTQAAGNGDGIQILNSAANTVGGLTQAERNIVSGNNRIGINLSGPGSVFNRVMGNNIGTDVTGQASVPNFQGVVILGAAQNLIGGVSPGMGNVISGNASAGIQIFNDATVFNGQPLFNPPGVATGNVIQGNLIGLNAAGTGRLGNAQGIFINDASGNLVGGSTPGAGNVVAGNRSIGIQILGDNATNNAVLGNLIGTNRAGARGLGNTVGVFVYARSGNFVAPPATPGGNTIQFNTTAAVRVRQLAEGPQVELAALLSNPSNGAIRGIGLTFTTYLANQRALNPANYIVATIGRNFRPGPRVPIASVTYDEIFRLVTVTFARQIPRNTTLQLRVVGTSPGGLTDRVGNFLAGTPGVVRRNTGSDFQATFIQGVRVQTSVARTQGINPLQRGSGRVQAVSARVVNPPGHLKPSRNPV
jgi:hypothetical protein